MCYKVENLFVKMLSKKQDPALVKEKVNHYRLEKERVHIQKKLVRDQKASEQRQVQLQRR